MKSVVGSTLWSAGPSLGKMDVPAVFLASRVSQQPGPGGGRRGGGSMIFIQLVPHTNVAGKVADLTLSYRPPNSTERITQTLTLDYMRNPQVMLETPYLSYPEMSERYAMYNVFLGLRYATKQANFNCASAALQETRAAALAWNAKHEDPDISADVSLIDMYITNLRTHGATDDTTLASCNMDYPDDDYVGEHDHQYACSAGGNPRGRSRTPGPRCAGTDRDCR
jgi:hypothetical protein